ncbi:unnamed protein product, partial [Agarophyton chilense]
SLFAALCTDAADSAPKRAAHRAAHLRWASLPSTQTIFAGPLRVDHVTPPPSPLGSLLVLRAATFPAARRLLVDDPYARAQLFGAVDLRAWRCGFVVAPMPSRLFVVWCEDRADCVSLRAATRPAHLQWWTRARRAGFIGPLLDDSGVPTGTLIVCDGDCVADVRRWAATDPYNVARLFRSVTVRACDKVIDNLSSLSPPSS